MCDRIFFHTEHKNLWDWLAHHPGQWKTDYPAFREITATRCAGLPRPHDPTIIGPGTVLHTNHCYACISAVMDGRQTCEWCALEWMYTEEEVKMLEAEGEVGASNCFFITDMWHEYTEQYERLRERSGLASKLALRTLGAKIKRLAERIRDMPIKADYDGLVL